MFVNDSWLFSPWLSFRLSTMHWGQRTRYANEIAFKYLRLSAWKVEIQTEVCFKEADRDVPLTTTSGVARLFRIGHNPLVKFQGWGHEIVETLDLSFVKHGGRLCSFIWNQDELCTSVLANQQYVWLSDTPIASTITKWIHFHFSIWFTGIGMTAKATGRKRNRTTVSFSFACFTSFSMSPSFGIEPPGLRLTHQSEFGYEYEFGNG